jgi:hypothetical protein
MSVADYLISDAPLDDTCGPPFGYACASGAPSGTIVTVSGMFSGWVITLCSRAE